MRLNFLFPSLAIGAFSGLLSAAQDTSSGPGSGLLLDSQLGPYPVSIYEHEIKTNRSDPLAPTPQNRRLMITVYRPFLDNFTCPTEDYSRVQYIPSVVSNALLELLSSNSGSDIPSSAVKRSQNATSPLDSVQIYNCSRSISSSPSAGPLLLFSPGLGGTHHVYTGTLQAAASSGYTVVAIDHTYEAAAVIFPDGSVEYASDYGKGNSTTTEGLDNLTNIRVADTISVLDAIELGQVPGVSTSSCTPNLKTNATCASTKSLRTVMYGHSLGGSTAANVASVDPRVLASINIDGTFFGPVANKTITKPIFMLASEAGLGVNSPWLGIYQNQVHAWKTLLFPNNTVHYGFTDIPLLADLLDVRGSVFPESLTGSIDSRRLQEFVWRYTLEFFDYVFEGERPGLLLAKNKRFPDVEFIAHADA